MSSSDGSDFINMDVEDERDMNEEIHDDFQNRDGNFDQPNNNVENVLNDEVCNLFEVLEGEHYFLKYLTN